ncbi:MAG: serine/threonine-protein kinase [Planctomycetia bacterium]|nr:serine/threonine-protein kinase [Planctomycetia bacterium]
MKTEFPEDQLNENNEEPGTTKERVPEETQGQINGRTNTLWDQKPFNGDSTTGNDFVLAGGGEFQDEANETATFMGTDSRELFLSQNNQFVVDPKLVELSPGVVLAQKYKLKDIVGQGGMGEIWKAFDIVSDKPVALKFVLKGVKNFEQEIQRVRQMFSCVHALSHQHICQLYSMEFDDVHGFYLVMAWMEGINLHQLRRSYLFRNEPFPKNLIIPILIHVAEALDYAHQNNVVHRDVKAANIYVQLKNDRVQNVYLYDFGLGSEIQTDPMKINHKETSGTYSYMPPEQWQGDLQDAKTDQYALAVVAYLLYSGHLPFSSDDPKELKNRILYTNPDRIPDVAPRINDALLKALSKKQEDRFPNCVDFITAMDPDPYSENYLNVKVPLGQRIKSLFSPIGRFISRILCAMQDK